MEETILTVEQVAQILQVHPFTVLKFIKQGKLTASKLGRVYRIRRSDVDKFLDAQVSISRATPEPKIRKKSVKKVSPAKDVPRDSSLTDESKGVASKEEPIIIKTVPEEAPEEKRNGEDHYIIDFTY
jgi:excisionase family DNA binding protein